MSPLHLRLKEQCLPTDNVNEPLEFLNAEHQLLQPPTKANRRAHLHVLQVAYTPDAGRFKMPTIKPLPESHQPSSSLRLPANKRIALPVSQRLSSITEDTAHAADLRWSRLSFLRNSTSSAATGRTPPPAYDWVPESIDPEGDEQQEAEKLARLRRSWSAKSAKRGGWGRVAIIGLVILGIIGLAVGLGVGLTVGRKKHTSDEQSASNNATTSTDTSEIIRHFPLGQYSFLTNLRSQQTNCTSNPATWRCYPYTVFDPSNPSTSTSSQATFDWIIKNTSYTYATNATVTSTPLTGTPANLTISSTDNPFALNFPEQSLTYHSAASNTTSTRLTFFFTLPKTVVPFTTITTDNAAAQCFFNNTVFSGTIYLSAPRGSLPTSTMASSGEAWPYAVEIAQSSEAGSDVPDCYEVQDGKLGQRVEEGVEALAEGSGECICEYANF